MPPDNPFLQAILDHPDDDTPRLIYADWLEERGETDRAEFIRLQIEREKLPAADPRWQQLRDRERALLAIHEIAWRSELPTFPSVNRLRFWRGLVGGADVSHFPHFRRHSTAIFAAAPIQFLRLFSMGTQHCQALHQINGLERVIHLSLVMKRTTEDALLAIASCAHLRNVRRLVLVGDVYRGCFRRGTNPQDHAVTETAATALLDSPNLQSFKEFRLRFHFFIFGPETHQRLVARFGEDFSR